MIRLIEALDEARWHMPSEWEGENFGKLTLDNFREAARLLFTCRIAAEISDSQYWLERYHKFLYEKPGEGIRTRLEVCRDGFALHMVESPGLNGQFWINLGAQAALRELCLLENDPYILSDYRHGLYINGITVLPILNRYKSYSNNDTSLFDMDWRCLEKFWMPHKTIAETLAISDKQRAFWYKEVVPRRHIEHSILAQVLYANWIAQLSGNSIITARADEALEAAVKYVDWATLHVPCAYVAECAWYESLLNKMS